MLMIMFRSEIQRINWKEYHKILILITSQQKFKFEPKQVVSNLLEIVQLMRYGSSQNYKKISGDSVNQLLGSKMLLNQRIKTETSMILSPDDIESSVINRINSFQFFKSNSSSPSTSQYLKSEHDSQAEEQNARLSESLHHEKERSSALTMEVSNLYNEMRVSCVLNNELECQKTKLVNEIRNFSQKYEKIQREKITLIENEGNLKTKINSLNGTLEVYDETIYTLTSNNRKLVDEINFQKENSAELKKQNLVLRAQLQSIIRNYTQAMKEMQKNMLNLELVDQINLKVKELFGEIEVLRLEIQGVELKATDTCLKKKQLFKYTSELESKIRGLNYQMDGYRSGTVRSVENQDLKVKIMKLENEWKEKMGKKDEEIDGLKLEITHFRARIQQLEEKSISSIMKENVPELKTNTQYLNQVIKENFRENQQKRQIMDQKEEQIERLKSKLVEEEANSRNKLKQIQRLEMKLKHSMKSTELKYGNNIEELSQENKHLQRKIEQMAEKQQMLRGEINEKDQIILTYVQKKKESCN